MRLGMVLATQYASQLRDADPHRNVLAAVLGNVGTIASYRVGVGGCQPTCTGVRTVHISSGPESECPNFEGYMRVHLDSVVARPFSVSQMCLTQHLPTRAVWRRLLERSRLRHGVPAAECVEIAPATKVLHRSPHLTRPNFAGLAFGSACVCRNGTGAALLSSMKSLSDGSRRATGAPKPRQGDPPRMNKTWRGRFAPDASKLDSSYS